MKQLQANIQVIGPGDRSQYSVHEGSAGHVSKEVGVHGFVTVDGLMVLEGRLDPDRLDLLAQGIETGFTDMEYVHLTRSDRSPDTTREGWGLRWVEHVIQGLRSEIQRDLSNAVERLAARHDQLGRFK